TNFGCGIAKSQFVNLRFAIMQRVRQQWIAAFGNQSLRHATLPVVPARQQAGELLGIQLRQIHLTLRPDRHGLALFIPHPDDAPNASQLAVHTFGIGLGVLVAGILVAPVSNPDHAVGTGLHADRTEPPIVAGEEGATADLVIAFARAEQFGLALGLVSRADWREAVAVDGALVDVAD